MKILRHLPLVLLSASAIANGAPIQPAPAQEATTPKSNWNVYAGFAGGLDILQGKRQLVEVLPAPAVNRVTKPELSGNGASFELFAGATYRIPNTIFSFGLDPYLSYSNVKSNDFNSVVVPVGNVNAFSSVSSSWASRFGGGLDLKAGLNVSQNDCFFGFVGTQLRQFQFKYNDHFGTVSKTKSLWAFAWGLGYEHRFATSSVGIKFRNDLFDGGSFSYGLGGSQFQGSMKPKLYSFLLTYKYNFIG